jgi:hypothetical protein
VITTDEESRFDMVLLFSKARGDKQGASCVYRRAPSCDTSSLFAHRPCWPLKVSLLFITSILCFQKKRKEKKREEKRQKELASDMHPSLFPFSHPSFSNILARNLATFFPCQPIAFLYRPRSDHSAQTSGSSILEGRGNTAGACRISLYLSQIAAL